MARGQCMCGSVVVTVSKLPRSYGACHCEMCRRWTGSAFLGVTVPLDRVSWEGEEHIERLQSSEWAERAWCRKCGTGLWYRVTVEGPMAKNLELPIGLLDDSDALRMRREIFIDCKPKCFAYAGERNRLTREETLALYGVTDV